MRSLLVSYLASVFSTIKKSDEFLALLAGEEEGEGGAENREEDEEGKDITEWSGDLCRDLFRVLPGGAAAEGGRVKVMFG